MPIMTVSPAGMRLVKMLVGNPPQTVAELMDTAGVTRTAITEQLNELLAAGYVQRSTQRLTGRGRPRHLYSVTPSALLLLFAGNQRVVVPAMWQAIEEVGGRKLKHQIVKRVGRELAGRYRSRIRGKTRADRFRQMARILREEEGNLVEVRKGKNGQLMMRRRNCSFYSMYEDSRTVCQLDQQVMSSVIGSPVRRTACRHDGDACCVFEITDDS